MARWIHKISVWLKSLFRRRAADQELHDEIAAHLELMTDENIAKGMTPEQARRAARLELGGVEQVKEAVRAARVGAWLDTFLQDVRFGLRMLRKNPGFTVVAVLTLALGIGANTAMFSLVDWLTLRLPPIAEPRQIVTLASLGIGGGYRNGFSYPNFQDIRNQSTSVFSEMTASMDYRTDGLSADGKNEPIWASYVTGNFFETLGVKPALGTFIEPTPTKSPNDMPVLVIGYAFWKAHFEGDSRVIGKNVLVNGHPVTIIGIAPKGFHGITSFVDEQAYLPLGMAPVTADADKDLFANRNSPELTIVARLKPRVTLASAQPALKLIAERLSVQYPSADKWRSLLAYPLSALSPLNDPSTLSTMRLISALFLILAGLVLILACLNVANLLLVRASGRQREMAVRAAVGGGRGRLMRQLLTESLLLALLGCAAGIALGLVASRWLRSINLNTPIPFVLDVRFDWRVFGYALCAAVATALAVGIAPALRATRGNLNDVLHENAHRETAIREHRRGLLVIAQVAGSLMLLIIAGLFVRSLRAVQHSNWGFDPSDVLNFKVNAHQTGYNETESRQFLENLLQSVRALPGVETASLAEILPMDYTYTAAHLKIDGYRPPSGQGTQVVGYDAVSPQYFETMRTPILRGRGFLDSDDQTSPHVAVINEVMAENYWHGENPLGQHFTDLDDPKHSIEVIGVAKNSRMLGNFSSPIGPYMYFPLAQRYDYQLAVTLQLRSNLPPATMNREVVGVIHSLAPAMPVLDIHTMTEALDTLNGLMLFQIGATLASSLGILGLTLAVIGVYGVVAYGASRRTHEIGIRMALGARQSDVLRMILRQGLFVVVTGLIAGILAAAAMARLVGNFLSGVSPFDPPTYIGASILLAAVALLACYIPARRAIRVDPMVALRHE
jgi:putative ABC transport system permease protein